MSRLCLITALPAETRPLLDALNLRQIHAPHLRLYGADQYLLLETAAGKLNAAAATGAALNAYPDINAILNIGIAGGSFDYGQTIVANHIRDAASGAQWFPHLPAKAPFRETASARIDTLDNPGTHYPPDVLFDMEASGIYSAASRYLSTSQIHSVKVVSDNSQHDVAKISRESVIQLIRQALPAILPMLECLMENMAANAATRDNATEKTIEQALKATHHSVNDERQLRQLVLQSIALTQEQPTLHLQSGSAAKIRRALQLSLDQQPFVYGEH